MADNQNPNIDKTNSEAAYIEQKHRWIRQLGVYHPDQ